MELVLNFIVCRPVSTELIRVCYDSLRDVQSLAFQWTLVVICVTYRAATYPQNKQQICSLSTSRINLISYKFCVLCEVRTKTFIQCSDPFRHSQG